MNANPSNIKPRVLILDDDPEQLLLLGRTLRANGFEVEMLTSPIGITNVVRKTKPDMIILDVNVPAVSGDQLVEGIRKHHVEARIVLYSGSDASTLHGLARTTGANGWIQKGTPMDDVLRKLRRMLLSTTGPGLR
jgi:DNA-binding response OmpR family regulator